MHIYLRYIYYVLIRRTHEWRWSVISLSETIVTFFHAITLVFRCEGAVFKWKSNGWKKKKTYSAARALIVYLRRYQPNRYKDTGRCSTPDMVSALCFSAIFSFYWCAKQNCVPFASTTEISAATLSAWEGIWQRWSVDWDFKASC